jgi:hypothetical protein
MTSPIVVVGLTWDGFDLQRSDLDILFALTEGLDDLPQLRSADQFIPFLPGRLPSPAIPDRRAVVAVGWVTARGAAAAAAFRTYLDTLKAKLEPGGPPRILLATLENGTQRWIRAVPRVLIPGEGLGSDFRAFSIQWDARDPYWYGVYGSLFLDTGLLLDSGLFLDAPGETVFTPSSDPFYVNLEVPGTTDSSKVKVTVVAPSTGAVGVVAEADEVGFTFPTMAGGAANLIVDNELRTATQAGVSSRASLTLAAGNEHGEYIRLRPGVNRLRISGRPASVRVAFRPTYL